MTILWLTLLSLACLLLAYGLVALVRHVRPSAERQRFEDWARTYETTRQIDLMTRATIAAMRQAVREQSGQR